MRTDKNFNEKVSTITLYIRDWWVIDNLDQIAQMFNYANRSSAKKFLEKLVEVWLFEIKNKKYIPSNLILGYPLFESVRAWLPFTPENNASTQLEINKYLIDHPSSTFLVKVKWDSMKDAWIMPWDIAVVDKSANPKNNDIIIASIDNEVTIKYYKKEGTRISLIPANPLYKTLIINTDAEILWVVVGSIRKYG